LDDGIIDRPDKNISLWNIVMHMINYEKKTLFDILTILSGLALFLVISIISYSCGSENRENSQEIHEEEVVPDGWDRLIGIEQSNLMIDIPAVIIRAGLDQEHCISITILKSNIQEGYDDQAIRRDATARITAFIQSGRDTYIESSTRDTYIRVIIPRLDRINKEAELHIEARLVDTYANNRYFKLKTKIKVRGRQFDAMTE
jgi:hypothetical protein